MLLQLLSHRAGLPPNLNAFKASDAAVGALIKLHEAKSAAK